MIKLLERVADAFIRAEDREAQPPAAERTQTTTVARTVPKPAPVTRPAVVPAPPSLPARPALVESFDLRSIEHEVKMEDGGRLETFRVRAYSFDFDGCTTFAKVEIARPGRWAVSKTVMLTWRGRSNDVTDDFVAAFANAGYKVSFRLIEACLYPIQRQVLSLERELRSFGR